MASLLAMLLLVTTVLHVQQFLNAAELSKYNGTFVKIGESENTGVFGKFEGEIILHIFYRQLGCLAFSLRFWPKIKQLLNSYPASDIGLFL